LLAGSALLADVARQALKPLSGRHAARLLTKTAVAFEMKSRNQVSVLGPPKGTKKQGTNGLRLDNCSGSLNG
jgi:hypothetical protein